MPVNFDFTPDIIGSIFESVGTNLVVATTDPATVASSNFLQTYFQGRLVAYYQQVRLTGPSTWDSDLDSWQFEKKTRK